VSNKPQWLVELEKRPAFHHMVDEMRENANSFLNALVLLDLVEVFGQAAVSYVSDVDRYLRSQVKPQVQPAPASGDAPEPETEVTEAVAEVMAPGEAT